MQRIRPPTSFSNLSPRLKAGVSSHRASIFASAPSPPRLPKEEQELYEKLQNASTGAFSTPKSSVTPNTSEYDSPKRQAPQVIQPQQQEAHQSRTAASKGEDVSGAIAKVTAVGDGKELHPDVRRGAKAEFEGEKNPVTGEVGGPKNEPLRWGGGVDWSYNGRVTDF